MSISGALLGGLTKTVIVQREDSHKSPALQPGCGTQQEHTRSEPIYRKTAITFYHAGVGPDRAALSNTCPHIYTHTHAHAACTVHTANLLISDGRLGRLQHDVPLEQRMAPNDNDNHTHTHSRQGWATWPKNNIYIFFTYGQFTKCIYFLMFSLNKLGCTI